MFLDTQPHDRPPGETNWSHGGHIDLTDSPHLLGTQESYISLLFKLYVATWLALASKLR